MKISKNSLFIKWLAHFDQDLGWGLLTGDKIEMDTCKLSSLVCKALLGSLILLSGVLLLVMVFTFIGKSILYAHSVLTGIQFLISFVTGVVTFAIALLALWGTVCVHSWVNNTNLPKVLSQTVKAKLDKICIKINID